MPADAMVVATREPERRARLWENASYFRSQLNGLGIDTGDSATYIMPLVVGDHGEAAVLAFDSRLRLMQDFTSDSDKVKSAIEKINAGNSSSRMIDAVEKGVFMLRNRPIPVFHRTTAMTRAASTQTMVDAAGTVAGYRRDGAGSRWP